MQLNDYLHYLESIKRRYVLELASKTKFQLEVQARIQSLESELHQAKEDQRIKLPKELKLTRDYYYETMPAQFLTTLEQAKENADNFFNGCTARITQNYSKSIKKIHRDKVDAEEQYLIYRKKTKNGLAITQQHFKKNILCAFTLLDRKYKELFEQQHEEKLERFKQFFKKDEDPDRPLSPEHLHQKILKEINRVVTLGEAFHAEDLCDTEKCNKLIMIIDANEEHFNSTPNYPYLHFKNIRQFLKQGYLDADYSTDKPKNINSEDFLKIEEILLNSPSVSALCQQLNDYCLPEKKELVEITMSKPDSDKLKKRLAHAADKAKLSSTNLFLQAGNSVREQWHKLSTDSTLIECIQQALAGEPDLTAHQSNDEAYEHWSSTLTNYANDLAETKTAYEKSLIPHKEKQKKSIKNAEDLYLKNIEEAKENCQLVQNNKRRAYAKKISELKKKLKDTKALNPKGQIKALEKDQLVLLKRQVNAAFSKYEKIYDGFCLWHSKEKGLNKAIAFNNSMQLAGSYQVAIERFIKFFSDAEGNYNIDNTMRNHSFKTYLLKELFNENGGSFSLKDGDQVPNFHEVRERIKKGLEIYNDTADLTKIKTSGVIFEKIKGNTLGLFQFRRSNKNRSKTAIILHGTLGSAYTSLQRVT